MTSDHDPRTVPPGEPEPATPSSPQASREAAGVVTLWIIVFIGMMGFGITIVPFPIVAEQFGASPFWVTWGGTGSFALTQMISTPLLGRLSDRIGRKPVLLLGLVGAIIGYLWTAMADTLTSLLVARAFTGLCSGYLAAAFAYVGDVSTPTSLARRMGLLGAAFGLGFAAGPFLGGLLGRAADGSATLLAPCLFSAGLSTLGLLGTLFALRESHAPQARATRTEGPTDSMAESPQRARGPARRRRRDARDHHRFRGPAIDLPDLGP